MSTLSLQDYTIHIDDDLQSLPDYIQQGYYTKVIVLVDENTKAHCLPILDKILENQTYTLIEILSGENHKTIETCCQIWTNLMHEQTGRKALFLNLGGGVIGDMGGFCASTFKRGIDFIQIPTTLLSQVDASIGGKLGIDFGAIKNSIGLFKNPKAVFVESQFLKTLPFGELRSGYAEIIKHSLIADASQWQQLSAISDLKSYDNWAALIEPSLKIKQTVVQQDPFEKGLRKALNFGHTIGHAVESLALETDQPLLHGEAIAIGMICESYLSHKKGHLSASNLNEISQYIQHTYDYYPLDSNDFDDLLNLMRNDKKNKGAAINFTFLTGIGTCLVDQTCSDELICESLEYYKKLYLGS